MKTLLKKILNFLKKIRNIKKCNIDIGAWTRGKCNFEGKNYISKNTIFVSSSLGYGSYIGRNCVFVNVKIGKYTSIGGNVSVISGTHPTNYVSTHPFFYSKDHKISGYVTENKFVENIETNNCFQCEIGNDVWIGDNVLIRGGVKIGDGAIIGMGAVVTKDVEPYCIYGGVPAKLIRKRFNDDEIDKLLKIKWWDFEKDKIKNIANDFSDVTSFIERNYNENLRCCIK